MTPRWLALLPCLVVLLCALQPSVARAPLRVRESSTTLQLSDEKTTVTLAVENPSGRPAAARLRLELLDTADRLRASAEERATLGDGLMGVAISLPLSLLQGKELNELPWFRLRYKVMADEAGDAAAPDAEGIVSLSEITPDLFDLHLSCARYVAEGMRYRAHVSAIHPISSRPSEGVSLEAELKFAGAPQLAPLRASATTDAHGFSLLDFDLPREIPTSELRLTVTARRGALLRTAEDEISIERLAEMLVSTDKPIYQPGQIMHARLLMLEAFVKRAVADMEVEAVVKDPEDTVILRTQLKTSRFGIAAFDWPISDTARLGSYEINFRITKGKYEDSEAIQRVRVSRYDLPNFTVAVRPDRKFYLPGENAEVAVSADYLFGRPVKRGRVRLVRETDRSWNFKEQKWDIEEEETYEGIADEEGRYVARVDLSKVHADLTDPEAEEERSERFRDLTFVAYVTDPTTNRTEQRRFQIRVTREPLHVYVSHDYRPQSRDLPLNFYISTFYADGTPASCTVRLEEKRKTAITASAAVTPDGRGGASYVKTGGAARDELGTARSSWRTIKTNRFGLAEFNGPPPAPDEGEDELTLLLTASDRRGQTGHRITRFDIEDESALVRVEPLKTLHRAGEPIRARILTNARAETGWVEVARGWKVVAWQEIRLKQGRATVEIPYSEEFKNELAVAAFVPTGEGSDEVAQGARAVIYPQGSALRLDVQMNRDTYGPGEEAVADFRVRSREGREVESALGVTIYDRAVEERANTDLEFGRRFTGFGDYYLHRLGAFEELAGVTRHDLDTLDLSRPLPAGMDLLAAVMLNKGGAYVPTTSFSQTFERDQQAIFRPVLDAQLRPLKQALDEHYRSSGEYPKTEDALRSILAAHDINFDALRDPWGMPYSVRFSVNRDSDVLEIFSAAADKHSGTADDFTALEGRWPYFRSVGLEIKRALAEHHKRTGDYIRDANTFKAELSRIGLDFGALRDPWGKPYKPFFSIREDRYMTVEIKSGGPNMRFGTERSYDADDFTLWTSSLDYFDDTRTKIEHALDEYRKSAKRFPQDEAEFRAALRQFNLDEAALRDPLGRPLHINFSSRAADTGLLQLRTYQRGDAGINVRTTPRATVSTLNFINLLTLGPDGQPGTYDDTTVATFTRLITKSDAATTPQGAPAPQGNAPAPQRDAATPPQGPNEGNSQAHANAETPAGGASGARENRDGAGLTGALGGVVTDPQGAVIPGATVTIKQTPDGQTFETKTDEEGYFFFDALPAGLYELRIEASGFIGLLVADVSVADAKMTELLATLTIGSVTEAVTVTAAEEQISTTSSNYSVGHPLNGSATVIASRAHDRKSREAVKPEARWSVISTPRLREYFPETLVWQPALETDANGHAQLRFKVADSITTWKMAVVGSTEEGELAYAEKEFRAFQPFFVEHDPPRFLTEGDEIQLPVVLRNYLDKAQQVETEIRPETWFALTGPASQTTEVPPGESLRAVFGLRAVSPVREGKQRVSARAAEASDAIERSVTVRPNGEEVLQTAIQVFKETAALDVRLPAEAIGGTARAELKIYPNMSAHLVEGVEAIMGRPYGCAEQLISSTYPSILVLRHYALNAPGEQPPVVIKARRYLQFGYERLLNNRNEDGGFAYWRSRESDTALTAYALRMLVDASTLINIDEDAIEKARTWLVRYQSSDGSWKARRYNDKPDEARDAMLTAYVARVLARVRPTLAARQEDPDASATEKATRAGLEKETAAALERALLYLSKRASAVSEPQLLALYTLAAFDSGDTANAGRALSILRQRARKDSDATYWTLSSETPFHGWGLTGNVETTALAIQALARARREARVANPSVVSTDEDDQLINGALLFLFRTKDRYGVWLSTQATVNVLDTFYLLSTGDISAALKAKGKETGSAALDVKGKETGSAANQPRTAKDEANAAASQSATDDRRATDDGATTSDGAATGEGGSYEIFVNGARVGSVALPPREQLSDVLTFDLSPFIKSRGNSRLEIRRTRGTRSQVPSVVQAVTTFYVPWKAAGASPSHVQEQSQPGVERADAAPLRLSINFDKTEAEINQEITCSVEAVRAAGHYGMLLGEIGLPPGAEVDRASLERAVSEPSGSLDSYDVLPDRLVVYLWPSYKENAARFTFKFRPRFGINAHSAPSLVYDYYNPEASAVVAPVKFVVR